jgi:hypothetical protein
MSDPKNPFESRDLESRFDQEIDTNGRSNGGVTHGGGERRHYRRRKKTDRRTDIRFEIDKEDRRKNSGRRLDDGVDVSR